MSIIDAIVLGLVQGLTEFLPVSSSGHLVMSETLLGVSMPGIFFEVALHLATLLAVVIVYRRRLGGIVAGAFTGRADAWRYILLLALATVPAAIVGLLLKDFFERVFDAPAVTGVMLIVTGAFLWTTRFVEKRREPRHELDAPAERADAARFDGAAGPDPERARPSATSADPAVRAADRSHRPIPAPSWPVALAMGVAQAFAILPGISRSGSTITTGLWARVDGERAAEFSFLMSIPAILGAVVLQLGDMGASFHAVGGLPLGISFVTALVSGVAAIKWLVWLVRRQAFHQFAYYVIPAGGLFLLYLALR